MPGFSFLNSTIDLAKVVQKVQTSIHEAAQAKQPVVQGIRNAQAVEASKIRGVERTDVTEFIDLGVSSVEQAEKRTSPAFERAAKNFVNDEPELIFVAEYVVEDESVGSLLVWERYRDATHYEVFKKNLFSQSARYERILFLDNTSLDEEKERLLPYIKDTLGFTDMDEENIFIFLDHKVKDDRIYEYKVKATRVPQKVSEIDFDLCLESQGLMTNIPMNETSTNTVFGFAGKTLQSEGLAWVIALLNEDASFFGKFAATNSLSSVISKSAAIRDESLFISGSFPILVPRNMQDLLILISESINLFGIRETFGHMVDVIGGLSKEFRCSFIDAFDETRNVFSYDRFKRVIIHQLPVFQLLLNLSESKSTKDRKALSQLAITLPKNKGSETITSVDGLSKVMKFVNDVLIIVLYSQDNFDKIKEIIGEIAITQELEVDPLEDATDEVREEEADEVNTSETGGPKSRGDTTSVSVAAAPENTPANSLGVSSGTTAGPKARRKGVVTQPKPKPQTQAKTQDDYAYAPIIVYTY